MNSASLPILLISFNRPELTRESIRMLSSLAPTKLFYSVDGPREDNVMDIESVNECRNLTKLISWDCDLKTNFALKNYGSGLWPYESINWAFRHVEKLLILEDDVFISEDFYRESINLINQYEGQSNIFGICASNISDLGSYEQSNEIFCSKYFSGWGWATWKDRWEEYRFDITSESKIGFLKLMFVNNCNVIISLYFLINFYLVKRNKIQAWDYQINHLIFSRNKYVIKFKKNLSSNIGVGKDATHTKYLPKIQVNKIDGSYDSKIRTALIPEEERKWRKSRTRFIVTSWLLRIQNFEKNTAR